MYNNSKISISSDMLMADLILMNPHFLLLLDHFSIKLEVQEKSIAEVCRDNSISPDVFLAFANLFTGKNLPASIEYSINDVQIIISYLKNCHSYYLNEKCPQLSQYISTMNKKNDSSEMSLVQKFFKEYVKEITEHMVYENETVFPYIKELYSLSQGKKKVSLRTKYSVKDYKEQHDDIEEKLTDLKNLLVKYLPVKKDSTIRRTLLIGLSELEYDLSIHSLIEDTILIPLVERLETFVKKGHK